MKNIKIIIATHKKYEMPKDDMYIPVHVGAEGKESIGYQPDNVGENISKKNAAFCELTGLYWAWKNLEADYVGLAHYRRHFKGNRKSDNVFEQILTKEEADKLLSQTDILVTKKRNYYIENIYDHYAHTLYVETLDKAKEVIDRKYPEYSTTFEKCMKRTHMHAFNMFVMKKEKLDAYCEWLFDILFEVEEELKDKKYDAFHARFFGRVSERLLDVWIKTNNLNYDEIKVIDMQNINWFKKGTSFLMAKFTGKKYEKSF